MAEAVQRRIGEFDFLKCVFILLMIVFHLVYIGDKYPYAKDWVYTFHIPAFLLISGYLMHIEKQSMAFLRSMLWIFIPYMIMEVGYVMMSSVLPVRGGVNHVTWQLLVDKVCLHPMGPYWYLHTLLLCGLSYFVVARLLGGLVKTFPMLVTLSLVYVGFSYGLGLVSPSSALYFMIGVVIKQSGTDFISFFRGSWWALIPLVLLSVYPENLDRFTISGILITYLVMRVVLAVYNLLPGFFQRIGCYIGKNSLVLLLFSPVFTMMVKPLVKVFSFDPSGMVFLFVSLLITVVGCFTLTWAMDSLGLSRYFFGKDKALQPY